jgi:hypothetical protein
LHAAHKNLYSVLFRSPNSQQISFAGEPLAGK